MKNYSRFAKVIVTVIGLTASNLMAQQPGVMITFSNMTETLQIKEKVDEKTLVTSVTSNFTVSGDVILDNTSTSNAPAFSLGLWTGQTSSNFDADVGDFPMFRKEKALQAGKTGRMGIKLKFASDQAGTFFFLTGLFAATNHPVITFVQIPSAE